MSPWLPWDGPDVPISDPAAHYVTGKVLLRSALVILGLIVVSKKEHVMQQISDSVSRVAALWFIRAAMFVALVSLPLYGYNDLDAWLFTVTGGDPYLYTLTVYSVARFGVIHIPTLIFAVFITLSAAMTPVFTDWLIVAVSAVVERLQEKMAWEDLEAVEVLDVEEVRK